LGFRFLLLVSGRDDVLIYEHEASYPDKVPAMML